MKLGAIRTDIILAALSRYADEELARGRNRELLQAPRQRHMTRGLMAQDTYRKLQSESQIARAKRRKLLFEPE